MVVNPRLKTYLKLAYAGPGEKQQILNRIPRTLSAYDNEGQIVSVRELLTTTDVAGTSLIQTEMYNTVMEGAKKVLCMRNAVRNIPMNSSSLKVPIRKARAYARVVPEAGEIPLAEGDYTSVTLTAEKIGERPLVSEEMIEDSAYAIAEMEIMGVGEMVENTLNQKGLTAWLDGSGLEHDTTGSNQGRVALAAAITKVREAGYMPDTVIMCPEFEGKLLEEYVAPATTNTVGAESAISTGRVGRLLGCDLYQTNVADASSTYTWGYAADGEIGAIVFDSTRFGLLGMRRNTTIRRFADPIRDMQSATVTARFGFGTATENTNAACRIEF